MNLKKRALVAMCADNGVVEEGVTQTGQEVTAIVAENFLTGDTSACTMCRQCGTDVYPVDVGMAVDTKVPTDLKVAMGTRNMVKEPAMTREEAAKGIEAGIEMVSRLKAKGYGHHQITLCKLLSDFHSGNKYLIVLCPVLHSLRKTLSCYEPESLSQSYR